MKGGREGKGRQSEALLRAIGGARLGLKLGSRVSAAAHPASASMPTTATAIAGLAWSGLGLGLGRLRLGLGLGLQAGLQGRARRDAGGVDARRVDEARHALDRPDDPVTW